MKKLSELAMILSLFLVSCPVAEALSKDMLIYDTMPVYFGSIDEGLQALSGLDGLLCAMDGAPLKDIQLSSTQISFAAAGVPPTLSPSVLLSLWLLQAGRTIQRRISPGP